MSLQVTEAVLRRAMTEVNILDQAWKQFQRSVNGLGIMTPEIMGTLINSTTTELEQFAMTIDGTVMQTARNRVDILAITSRRAALITQLAEIYEDNLVEEDES